MLEALAKPLRPRGHKADMGSHPQLWELVCPQALVPPLEVILTLKTSGLFPKAQAIL